MKRFGLIINYLASVLLFLSLLVQSSTLVQAGKLALIVFNAFVLYRMTAKDNRVKTMHTFNYLFIAAIIIFVVYATTYRSALYPNIILEFTIASLIGLSLSAWYKEQKTKRIERQLKLVPPPEPKKESDVITVTHKPVVISSETTTVNKTAKKTPAKKKVAKKKTAKKAPAKKKAVKKTPVKKKGVKKTTKKATAKKVVAKKKTAKKIATKKSVSPKKSAKKIAVKKAAPKKAVAKKKVAKKATVKKKAVKKVPAKKKAVKKTSSPKIAKKTTPRKTAVKKTAVKKAPAKKKAVKKAAPKKAVAKKTLQKKITAKKPKHTLIEKEVTKTPKKVVKTITTTEEY